MMNLYAFATAVLMLAVPLVSRSQERVHEGFYLSMQLGPAMGTVNGMDNQQNSLKIEGTGTALDVQIGGVVTTNLALHGVIGLKSIYGPTISIGGQPKVTVSKEYSFDEFIMGGGATYYLKSNFFVTGNAGAGYFSFSDESTRTTTDTGYGFSYQLKVGREWWISQRWSLGAALEYAGTHTADRMGTYEEKWNSNRFSVRLTATLNGRKY